MAPKKSEKNSLGNVLIIGGCGFVGHHIVQQLKEQYTCNVSVMDIRTTRNRVPNVEYYDGDITSADSVRAIFAKARPQIIIHTVSPAPVSGKAAGINKFYYKVNVEGTKTLLECASECDSVVGFIYTSSSSVIHDAVSDLINADERRPLLYAPEQREYYSETKAIAEQLVLSANRKNGKMLTVSVRPCGIFGEGDVVMTPRLMKAYRQGQTKFQLGNNDNLFDFTYVGNVAHAHILAAVALLQTHDLGSVLPLDHERVDGEAFIITNGSPVYFWDFSRMIWTAAGDTTGPSQIWKFQRDTGLFIAGLLEWIYWLAGSESNLTRQIVKYSSMIRYFDISKARQRLGYAPQTDLPTAVKRTVDWFLENEREDAAHKAGGSAMTKKSQ